ncbi:MAG: hypothetical protein FWH54_00285 [Methanobrevibacter sp.]|nr:hypothetical protein [Methanobrevibacter sp.]
MENKDMKSIFLDFLDDIREEEILTNRVDSLIAEKEDKEKLMRLQKENQKTFLQIFRVFEKFDEFYNTDEDF